MHSKCKEGCLCWQQTAQHPSTQHEFAFQLIKNSNRLKGSQDGPGPFVLNWTSCGNSVANLSKININLENRVATNANLQPHIRGIGQSFQELRLSVMKLKETVGVKSQTWSDLLLRFHHRSWSWLSNQALREDDWYWGHLISFPLTHRFRHKNNVK